MKRLLYAMSSLGILILLLVGVATAQNQSAKQLRDRFGRRFGSSYFYTTYTPLITTNLVAAFDPSSLHGTLTDGQAVNVSLTDISGNGNNILPSALTATTGLPVYHELDVNTGTGRGPTYAPYITLTNGTGNKNCLITPTGVRNAIGSGDVTIILITRQPTYAGGNFGVWGFCNGDAYRTGTGTINSTGSINVSAVWSAGRIKALRGSTQIGDWSVVTGSTTPIINKYKATVAKRVSGVWTVSWDGLPFQPAAANSTDPGGSNPLLDLAIGYFGNNSYPANEDLLYGAIYSRGLNDTETGQEINNFSVERLDSANILVTGNSILAGYTLAAADQPATYINAAYNLSSATTPNFWVTMNGVSGAKYSTMPNFISNPSAWGNQMSPIRGKALVVAEEETNQDFFTGLTGAAMVSAVHSARDTWLTQFKGLPWVTVYVSSMKPRTTMSELDRTLLHTDLVAAITQLNIDYPGYAGGTRWYVLDSGADASIGVSGAQNTTLYLTDKTHLSGTVTGGEYILINGYYLPTIASFAASL